MSVIQFSTYTFHTYSNPLCLHPKKKTIGRKKLTILCRFTRKFMLSSWRKALAYWSYWKGQEKGGDMKSQTPFESCLSNPMCFSVKLPRYSHQAIKPPVHFFLCHLCSQSYTSKPLLIPIPLQKNKLLTKQAIVQSNFLPLCSFKLWLYVSWCHKFNKCSRCIKGGSLAPVLWLCG